MICSGSEQVHLQIRSVARMECSGRVRSGAGTARIHSEAGEGFNSAVPLLGGCKLLHIFFGTDFEFVIRFPIT